MYAIITLLHSKHICNGYRVLATYEETIPVNLKIPLRKEGLQHLDEQVALLPAYLADQLTAIDFGAQIK